MRAIPLLRGVEGVCLFCDVWRQTHPCYRFCLPRPLSRGEMKIITLILFHSLQPGNHRFYLAIAVAIA